MESCTQFNSPLQITSNRVLAAAPGPCLARVTPPFFKTNNSSLGFSSTPPHKCQVQTRACQGEIVPEATQESLFSLSRRQCNVISVSDEGCYPANFHQSYRMLAYYAFLYIMHCELRKGGGVEVNGRLPSCFPTQENRPTENGVNAVASFTSCGFDVHRSGINSSPRGNVLGSGILSAINRSGSRHCTCM